MNASQEQAARLLGRGRGARRGGGTDRRTASERQAAQLLGRDRVSDDAEKKPRGGRTVGSRGVDGADRPAKRTPLGSATDVQVAQLRRRS